MPSTVDRAEVERVLEESLSAPLPPEDVDRLVEGVRMLRAQTALLRALALEELEPAWPPSAEESP